ncbi:uncharacterized protein LOC135392280 [Ornithodoros turicata]|uniref:uncharacterized protein LOC135392280 n=1 Tax=Ornithodoros turicata TaxID=34597 RepID=UPI0031392523
MNTLKDAVTASAVLAPHVRDDDRFQILDSDFNQYLDLADGDEIVNMATVRVFRPCASPAPTTEHNQAASVPDSVPSTSGTRADSTGSGGGIREVMHDVTDHDGRSYTLPQFGPLHALLRSGAPLTSKVHRKVINTLYQSMIKCSITPSRRFYSKVVSLLLESYPLLADVVGTGHESWVASLSTKFKNERRKIMDDERVTANRLKYGGRAKRKSDEDSANNAGELKRRKLHIDSATQSSASHVTGEDSNSTRDHEEWLLKEYKKESPNEELIDVRMALTMRERTASLIRLPVPVSKQTYPYLMDARRFFKEFERRYNQDPLEGTGTALHQLRELVIQRKINCTDDLRESLIADQDMEGIGETRRKHILDVHALKFLSTCVKESEAIESMFVRDDQELIVHPCVVYTGNSIEGAQHMFLYVDKVCLFRVTDLKQGTAAIISAYWLYNIEYSPKPFNTLCTLERLCLKVSETRARTPVIKFFNCYGKELAYKQS